MARAGKRVLVLERHYIAGGSTHAFEDHGYEFDTGLHYIGNIEKRKKYFNLVTDTPLEWDEMGRHPWDKSRVYDEVLVGDKSYDLRGSKEEYIQELVKHFPEERTAIEKWVELCAEVSKKDFFFDLKIARPAWLSRLVNHFAGKKFFEYTRKTALEVAQEVTSNLDLQAVLLAQFGDYGQLPSTESFFIHASVQNHYMNGGWYPRGGSTIIAKGMIPVIERAGGRVLVRKGVESILLDHGKAVGVSMESGEEIYAPMVISACGVFNTYKKLLPKESVPRSVIEKIERIGHSCSFIYLFVGMKGTAEELGLRSSNIWRWPERDYDAMLEKFYKDPEHAPIPMFMGFPCAKDSTYAERFPGRANSVIMTMSKFEWWEEWENCKQGKRGAEYEAKKKIFEDRILEEGLYKYYPQCRGRVDFTEVGSSLTFNHYIGSERGEVYGLESHPERFEEDDWLRPQTKIPNLFLTGQDVTTLGVTGAMMGGILTAHSALGYGSVVDIMSGRNLVEDIWHLDALKKKAD
eukprot:gene4712-5765_t